MEKMLDRNASFLPRDLVRDKHGGICYTKLSVELIITTIFRGDDSIIEIVKVCLECWRVRDAGVRAQIEYLFDHLMAMKWGLSKRSPPRSDERINRILDRINFPMAATRSLEKSSADVSSL
jgi:hypothetical protein